MFSNQYIVLSILSSFDLNPFFCLFRSGKEVFPGKMRSLVAKTTLLARLSIFCAPTHAMLLEKSSPSMHHVNPICHTAGMSDRAATLPSKATCLFPIGYEILNFDGTVRFPLRSHQFSHTTSGNTVLMRYQCPTALAIVDCCISRLIWPRLRISPFCCLPALK